MRIAALYFASLFLTALSLGGSWSHILQIRGKAPWPPEFWRTAMETLYRDYATMGAVTEVGPIIATGLLAYSLRDVRPEFAWTFTAATVLTLTFIAFWIIIAPINAVFASWTPETMPPNWTVYRDRWETRHAILAAAKALAFAALLIAVLTRRVALR